MTKIQNQFKTPLTQKPDSPPICLSLSLPSFSYGNEQILGGIKLEILAGETLVITGRSGIGKTTLLRILSGLESNHSGQIIGSPKIGYVFQEPTLLPWRTVLQNLCLVSGLNEQQANKMLEKVDLQSKGQLFPNQLSLGQQRRLALVRAFAIYPDLLLMDEPYVSLDSKLVDEMMDLFENLRADSSMSTVLVTHSQREIERLSDRELALEGTPARILINKN